MKPANHASNQTLIAIPPPPVARVSSYLSDTWQTLRHIFTQPEILGLMGILCLLWFVNLLFGRKQQGELTSAQWAGHKEKLRAYQRARKQLQSNKINDVCLWCGSPSKGHTSTLASLKSVITGPPTLYVPDANQSIAVIGRPKSGKTFSAINPMLKSAIEQGMAIALYDYKADDGGRGGQVDYIATLAAKHGYKVNIFAPGRPYSCTINPLDFIADANDDTTAGVLAEVFHKNLKGGDGRTDAFFGPAGQRLIQALFQFAKGTRYPDIAMAFSVARLPQLPERLIYAEKRGELPLPVQITFSQLMSTAGAEKTTSGIVATASDVLTRFMSQRVLRSMLGETNISIELGEKELIAFQSDIFRQDVISPLLAAIINVVVNRNFAIQRDVPMVFSADEFPTIYLPQAPTWPNEHRSKGFVGIFGFQSLPQIYDRYGREKADILLSGIGSRFWFNPGNQETARNFSDFLGDTEVTIQTRSWSHSRGDNWGRNKSISEQVHKRPLLLPDDFNRFGTGECIFINPAYRNHDQANLPQHLKQIRIPKSDIQMAEACEHLWEQQVRQRLIQREQQRRPNLDIEEQLRLRFEEAERLLPLPPDENDNAQPESATAGYAIPDF